MQNKRAITLFLIILLSITIVASTRRLANSINQTTNPESPSQTRPPLRKRISSVKTKEQWEEEVLNQLPAADYDAPQPSDPENRARREGISRHYDKRGHVVKNPDTAITMGIALYEGRESWALPAAESDAILVGTLKDARAYLSNDKSGVYMEFTVLVDEVVKARGEARIAPGGTVSASREGGVVRYSNNYRRLYLVSGEDLPLVGEQYLLFLKSLGPEQGYGILTAYRLMAGIVAPLDGGPQFETYGGLRRDAFLKVVRDEIANPTRQTPNK
jgi:hypothetical protein